MVKESAPQTLQTFSTVTDLSSPNTTLLTTRHDLRHFYASALIAGGASVKQVQERLCHSSPVIPLEIYAHLWPGEDYRTRDVMDAALTRLRIPCGLGEPEMPSVAGQTACCAASAFLAFMKSRTFCSDAGSVTSATER